MKELGPVEKYKNNYPLLFKYLLNKDVENLKYLDNINEFSNYMINYYSFNVSREDAQKKVLKTEYISL